MLQDYLKHNLKELQKKVLLRQLMKTDQDKIKSSNSKIRYANYDTDKQNIDKKFNDKTKNNILNNENKRNNEELDMKKQKIINKINYLDAILKRLEERKNTELKNTPIAKKTDDKYLQNLLKIGNMSPDLLSRSVHDPRDNRERQVFEYWVKNKEALQKKLQQSVSKKTSLNDLLERQKHMAIVHKTSRDKALDKMDDREKKIWNERKLQMEAEFGKNALKNIDNQILKINNNITDNQTALKGAKDLLNNFVRATNVFQRLKKLEEKRAEREKKWK